MQVGIAGLGKMGAAIGARLMETGHQVAVWNRTAEKAKPLAEGGAKIAASPAELAKTSEAIITILTDAEAIDKVYGGASGILAADIKGKLVIEMSTVQPATEIALAEKVRAKGGSFVECPVGGTTGPARQGKLIGLAGGSDADFARAKPLLDQMCRRVEHCGSVGAGASMKLSINLPLMIYWQALGEALAISRHLGLDPTRVMELYADTSGGPNVLKVRGTAIAKMLAGDDKAPGTFDLDSGRKDLRTMLAEGKARGVELPLVERTLASFDEASKAGWGARDASGQAIYWSRRGKK
ncbi:MAG: NAD(P)-dependent oxidoreductase [Rhizobiales bacterium]|nr:NAD(P)-dependent oxidoreductase [Hyphomicrobiales bacterium]